MSSPWG